MADILIHGMEKPGGCIDCDFCRIQDVNFETLYYCERNERFLDDEEACNIPSDCPIHELPEHGDLVEADKLREIAFGRAKEYGCVAFVDALDITLAPVIVPSNKEDAE